MFRNIRRWLLRRWLRQKFSKMILAEPDEIERWIRQVAEERIP